MSHKSWELLFNHYNIHKHNFSKEPYIITADNIKEVTKHLKKTGDREPRILCKHDTREKRPQVFIDNDLFMLPIKNGTYAIIQGEGYVDIPDISVPPTIYKSALWEFAFTDIMDYNSIQLIKSAKFSIATS